MYSSMVLINDIVIFITGNSMSRLFLIYVSNCPGEIEFNPGSFLKWHDILSESGKILFGAKFFQPERPAIFAEFLFRFGWQKGC